MEILGLTKKAKEKYILNMIYADSSLKKIVLSEEPDFVLHGHVLFGLEVTEFYFSDSSARVHNNPGYIAQILNDEKYMHKTDKKVLSVDDATYNNKSIKVIAQMMPPVSEYVNGIVSTVRIKDEKAKKYNQSLKFIELIVYDAEDYLGHFAKNKLYDLLYTSDMKKALRDTRFYEIYLISQDRNQNKIYIPLKGYFFIGETQWLMSFIRKKFTDLFPLRTNIFVMMCYQYLKHLGFNDVFCTDKDVKIVLHFSHHSLQIINKRPEYNDCRLYPDLEETCIKVELPSQYNIFNDTFAEAMLEFKRNSYLNMSVGIRVN